MSKQTVMLVGLLLANALIAADAADPPPNPSHPPRPGSVNYIEGQATIGGVAINPAAIGSTELVRDQVLATQTGKVEILLVPGVFLRLADNSSLKMVSPDLANVVVQLDKGRAMVEAVELQKLNEIRVNVNGAVVRIQKKGLYDFDADHGEVRVFDGSAQVSGNGKNTSLGRDRKLVLDSSGWKAQHFETRQYEDDFYRWSGLRSGFLSEASVEAARSYIGTGPAWYGAGWTGLGWYWSPWFGAYTFVPPTGVYYGPFGWPFYSPLGVYGSPYIFYGRSLHRFPDYHYPYGHGFPAPGRRPGQGPLGRR